MQPPIPRTPDEHLALMQYQADALQLLTYARGTLSRLRPNANPRIRAIFEEQCHALEADLRAFGVSEAMLLPVEGQPC